MDMYYSSHHGFFIGGWLFGAVLVALFAASLNRSRLGFLLLSLVLSPLVAGIVLLVMGKKDA